MNTERSPLEPKMPGWLLVGTAALVVVVVVDIIVWQMTYGHQIGRGDRPVWAQINANLAVAIANVTLTVAVNVGGLVWLAVRSLRSPAR